MVIKSRNVSSVLKCVMSFHHKINLNLFYETQISLERHGGMVL